MIAGRCAVRKWLSSSCKSFSNFAVLRENFSFHLPRVSNSRTHVQSHCFSSTRRIRHAAQQTKDLLLGEEEAIYEVIERQKADLIRQVDEEKNLDVPETNSARRAVIENYIKKNVSLADTARATLLFTKVMATALQEEDVELMEELMRQAEILDLPMTANAYHLMLIAYCTRGNLSSASRYLEIMQNRGVIQLFTYHLIITARMKLCLSIAADDICANMRTSGIQPTIETCNLLLHSYISSDLDPWCNSQHIPRIIEQNHLSPNSETYALLIESAAFHFESAMQIYAKFESEVQLHTVSPTNSILAAIIFVLSLNKKHKLAEQKLLEFPRKYGILLSPENAPSQFIVGLLKSPDDNSNAFSELHQYLHSELAKSTLTLKIIKRICKLLLIFCRDAKVILSLERWLDVRRDGVATEMERLEFSMQLLVWKQLYTYQYCMQARSIPPPSMSSTD